MPIREAVSRPSAPPSRLAVDPVFETLNRPANNSGSKGKTTTAKVAPYDPHMSGSLGPTIDRWQGYFGYCQTPSVLEALDGWIRRRLRSAAWKQWKHGPARFA